MASGWKGEKYRHSASRKGIKTSARGYMDTDTRDKLIIELTSELDDMKILYEELIQDPRKLTDFERERLTKRYTHNLNTNVIISGDYLLIPEHSHKNWLYYAGFEYIDEPPVKFGKYYVYENYEDRVQEIFEIIHGKGW